MDASEFERHLVSPKVAGLSRRVDQDVEDATSFWEKDNSDGLVRIIKR
jgi:hypothetical protein